LTKRPPLNEAGAVPDKIRCIGKMAVGQIGQIFGGKITVLWNVEQFRNDESFIVDVYFEVILFVGLDYGYGDQRGIVVVMVAKVSIFFIRLYAIELSLHGRPGRFRSRARYSRDHIGRSSIDRTKVGVVGNEKRGVVTTWAVATDRTDLGTSNARGTVISATHLVGQQHAFGGLFRLARDSG
jgi:hypothetical protein